MSRFVSMLLPYRPIDRGGAELDAEYAAGIWDYLRDVPELPRLGAVAAYCHHFSGNGSILEVGCGEAALLEQLNPSRYTHYCGIDISTEAIHRATLKGNQKTTFIAADATDFVPDERFDVIVFNECLQYFQDPLALVERYERFLTSKGFLMVSQFVEARHVNSVSFWEMIAHRYRIKAEAKITTVKTRTWIIKVFRPFERTLNV